MTDTSVIDKYTNLDEFKMKQDVRSCPVLEAKVVADYIVLEMKKNVISPRAQRMKADYQSVFTQLKVLHQWASLVGYGKLWDHKAYIWRTFGEYSLDTQSGTYLPYDIWSNIHYGYIGKSIGISAWTLLSGAGAMQLLKSEVPEGYIARRLEKFGDADVFSALDDPRDQIAIHIGIKLWERHKQYISTSLLMERIRANASGLVE